MKTILIHSVIIVVLMLANGTPSQAQKKEPWMPIKYGNGRLEYFADSAGNHIPDFSYCGYKASEEPIPAVSIKRYVPLVSGDATDYIQSAINEVSSLPPDANGFRGALLLLPGTYTVNGRLHIDSSGVVLRGSGIGDRGTMLIAAGKSRDALLRIAGKMNRVESKSQPVTKAFVPVNDNQLTVMNNSFSKGDKVLIRRPSTASWIEQLGTALFGGGISALGWKPGDQDIIFDRTITHVSGNSVTLDLPLTTAIDSSFGGATISAYQWKSRIQLSGVENLQMVSAFDATNAKDENHCWNAIEMENARDCWVRQIDFRHFAGSAVRVSETASRISVEDCRSFAPVSEIGGQRRYTFFTAGQQTLFKDCYAEDGYHDFATGFCAAGPNAFVECESVLPHSFSGAVDSWASGVLFDIVSVDGEALRFGNRGQDANGAGWAAANSMFWNCSASRIDCYKPPTAENWSFGSWSQFAGDGFWAESNNHIQPRSLFYAQLKQRLGKNVIAETSLLPFAGEASSSPSVEVAQQLTLEANQPKVLLRDWIGNAHQRTVLGISHSNIAAAKGPEPSKTAKTNHSKQISLNQGVIQNEGGLLNGRVTNVQWWSGGLRQKDINSAKPHVTRYVPGRYGKGLTDLIPEVTAQMKSSGTITLEHNYGLWYDRRRDDHERVRRMNGEVWPPFYELPFARSGQGKAWDGLSKYDLTKFNDFYWSRLKEFADSADQQGLILWQHHFFQHNIIEAGAHYADFPWRTANNINNTGFVEPVNYAGDKRIFYADQFYDTTNATRNLLLRNYIRQCLAAMQTNSNVIHSISEEYTGPLHFVLFWLDVIREWEAETGQHPLIALSVTKDVQDAVLAKKEYADIIDIIDIRYWHYQADGTTYAPMGGQQLAPRQHARLLKPKKTSFAQVYRAVLEYRQRFPGKAITYNGDNYTEFGIAVLMAGGSLPVLPGSIDKKLVNKAIGMEPVSKSPAGKYILRRGNEKLEYNLHSGKLSN